MIVSCDKKVESVDTARFISFPEFTDDLKEDPYYINSLMHQNCCECKASGCSARKCCSGTNGGNCSCTCSNQWHGGSSCSCSGCSAQVSYNLYLTDEQYSLYSDFNNILLSENSIPSKDAQKELINALNAIAADDFEKFNLSKVKMGSYFHLLNNDTKNMINSFLDRHGFEDEALLN